MFFLVSDDFTPGFFQGARIKESVAAQVLIVVTNKQFQFSAHIFGKPCSATHCGLLGARRINDAHYSGNIFHGYTSGHRALTMALGSCD
jgi:hypothetical protein